MPAQATAKVLTFPSNLVTTDRTKRLMRPVRCPVCNYPSATRKGSEAHRRLHSDAPHADRNWEIFYGYIEQKITARELAESHHLHLSSVYRIIQRGLAYPGIYELEEGF